MKEHNESKVKFYPDIEPMKFPEPTGLLFYMDIVYVGPQTYLTKKTLLLLN
jgi:hypothetical protein